MESENLENLRNELRSAADPVQAVAYARFFKTAPGDYGYGDKFYGIKVPNQRKILKKYTTLSFEEIHDLLISPYHEERFIALQILVHQFQKKSTDENRKKEIFDFYMKHMDYINNWDLVDCSAPQIVGCYLYNSSRDILFDFARSAHLWKKRTSILSTLYFIRKKDFLTTLELSEILLHDAHDLIHKAVGWMLREVANRDIKKTLAFLDKNGHDMPRTMLRYAIEKFRGTLRQKYLKM